MKRTHRLRTALFVTVATGAAFSFLAGGVFLLWASTLSMPTVETIQEQRKERSTKLYDRTGEVLLYDMHQDVRQTDVPLTRIADHLKQATIAIEDARFYSHFGIEPLSILRAIIRNLEAGNLLGGQGGSTITQQVVKNALLSGEKTVTRKLKEWVLAIKLEREMSKDQILELYLNEAPYGGTLYGAEEASQGFFGKSARDLTIAESAYLAALPQAPTYYSPYGNNRAALDARKNTVLARMFEQGYITREEHDGAVAEVVAFRPHVGSSIKAPHFVFFAIEELAKLYGDTDLAQANLTVITTLDWNLQREAEHIVLTNALKNATTYNASNASLMAIDPGDGAIMVMVGSRDYFDESIDGNYNIGLATRQPGSAFKPFAYAAAFAKGYTTETILYDTQTQFSTTCDVSDTTSENGCYAPGNYDNVFRGPMTMRNALAQSVNVPAVKAVYLAGLKDTIELARRMGVTTLGDYRRYGLTLVLGGGEVSLLEMTSAYGVFARDGYRHPYTSIKEVRDGTGNVLTRPTYEGGQILNPDVAHAITDVLADNDARTPAFGSNSFLFVSGRDVAVKTGTTNDYRDAWIIGYTPNIAVGAWAGNNDNAPMQKKVAGFIVAPMWHEFMQQYFTSYPEVTTFTPPPPIDPNLKPVLRGVASSFVPDTTATATPSYDPPHSILHWVSRDDPRGPAPSNPVSDPQYRYWEYGVLRWMLGANRTSDTATSTGASSPSTTVPTVQLRSPDPGDRVRESEQVRVRGTIKSLVGVAWVEYYLDKTLMDRVPSDTVSYTFTPATYEAKAGIHTIRVVAYDTAGAYGEISVPITVR